MRNFIVGLLIFMAGWGLSRFTYNYVGKDLVQSPLPVSPLPINTSTSVSDNSEQSATGMSTKSSAHVDDIDRLLQRNEFEAAVDIYESLQLQINDNAAEIARNKILSHARQLIEQSRFNQAESLLQRILVSAFRDVEARMLLAEVFLGKQNIDEAIGQLYETKGYAYRPLMLQRITRLIRSVVATRVSALKDNNDQKTLVTLYQRLTQLEPEHAPWFMGLASAQFSLEDYDAAISSLQLVLQDPGVGAQAQIMLSALSTRLNKVHETQPQVLTTEVVGIPLQRRGNHFIVDASPAPDRNIQLLIDTGASLTMISPEVFDQQGFNYKNTGKSGVFNTANGPVQAPIVILDSLTVGDAQVNHIEVGVLTIPGDSTIDGLLGMNFLKHFQFFIDQNEDSLRLSIN